MQANLQDLQLLVCVQVSEQGDAVYVFPPNFAGIIQSRSTWLKIAPFINRLKRFGGSLVRIGFGVTLVASVALVWLAIFALITASSQDNRDRQAHPPLYRR